jgi:methyl-accepting chemotaxis protein
LGEALSEVVTVSNKMGEGDLSHQVSGDYQGSLGILKDSVNTTRINFSEIVSKVRSAAEKVHGSSVKISQGSDELSTRTSEQAANLEQTSSSMEEIASTVNMNSESASQANRLSAEALQHAQNGGQVAAEAVTAMLGINASSAQIAEIITLIDGLAFQTNLLALNAAVEAARAGEQGQGFAVVAGEVRALAQRSASAAKDIKELIQDSGNRIEQGSDLVSSSGVALNSIVKSVEKMTSISSEIESATKEQTLGINQVNSAVTQLDSVTQQNMSLVEETAAACSQLKYEADELANMVSVFKLKA